MIKKASGSTGMIVKDCDDIDLGTSNFEAWRDANGKWHFRDLNKDLKNKLRKLFRSKWIPNKWITVELKRDEPCQVYVEWRWLNRVIYKKRKEK